MNTEHYQVVIVGSGLAGMSAAKVFQKLGIRFLIVDENNNPGGQLIRKQPYADIVQGHLDSVKKAGYAMAEEISECAEFNKTSKVLGIFDNNKLFIEDARGNARLVVSDYILLATGARERFLPFKGWTLPGVVSLGASQIMMKSSGILPGKNTVVAGSGPLPYVLAGQILRSGGKVPLLIDRASLVDKMKFLTVLPTQWEKLFDGMRDMGLILHNKTKTRDRHAVLEARGDGCVEEVVYAKLDQNGKFIPGSEVTVAADSLAIGQGFVANTELAANAGCELSYQKQLGGWIVEADECLKTSVENIYIAGELSGIGGGEHSTREGELAALTIAQALGEESPENNRRISKLQQQRKRQHSLSRFIAKLSDIPVQAWTEIPDDAILCRCEDITMKDFRNALDIGLDSIPLLKRGTRMGMGRCQGRTCSPIVEELMKAHLPETVIAPQSVRFPVKPTNLSALKVVVDE